MIRNLSGKFDDLSKICDFNKYTMKYLIGVSRSRGENVGEEESDKEKELDLCEGQAKEISQLDSDDDEDMGELAAKWVDEDDDDSGDDDEDDDDENSDESNQE